MNYYINEYSLRGQFQDIDEFFASLRNYTLPALKRIEEDKGNVIWKKDDLWKSNICKNINITNIPLKRNERSPEKTALLTQIRKLAYEDPHWDAVDNSGIMIKEYQFDYEYREQFEEINCFIKGIYEEGRILSFFHNAYQSNELKILVENEQDECECLLDNIYSLKWWDTEPEICKWYIDGKYKVEIRAKEFNYHPPHFHVSYNEYSGVFKLRDGKLYKLGSKKFLQKEIDDIYEWYKEKRDELNEVWNKLHPKKKNF